MMKNLHAMLAFMATAVIFAQEIPIRTDVKAATVYLRGAQIQREKVLEVRKGITTYKFTGLSPYLLGESIQVSAGDGLLVLGVNHHKDFLKDKEPSGEEKALQERLDKVRKKISLQKTQLEINAEEIVFLQENRKVNGGQGNIGVDGLSAAMEFYSKRLSALKLKALELEEEKLTLLQEERKLEKQLKSVGHKNSMPGSEILVKVKAERTHTNTIKLQYLESEAGWRPLYDIRANSLSEPISMDLKAMVRQMTGEDWKDVKLTLSTANPNRSGKAPELHPWFLSFNQPPPDYSIQDGEIRGSVYDEQGQPLAGANVLVQGTTIGTQTDFSGQFDLPFPGPGSILEVSYIGYETTTLPVRSNQLHVVLRESMETLEEVVVTRAKGLMTETAVEADEAEPAVPPTRFRVNPTSVSYELELPYSLSSDMAATTVDIKRISLPAEYRYLAVPRVSATAYLEALVSDWREEDLLAGLANIYFENTYVGKTLLDPQQEGDSLLISLGADKQVQVQREKLKDKSSKNFIGNRREAQLTYRYICSNGKSTPISLQVVDQVPISTREDIDVTLSSRSGATWDAASGKLSWLLSLPARGQETFRMGYEVEYPKGKTIYLE